MICSISKNGLKQPAILKGREPQYKWYGNTSDSCVSTASQVSLQWQSVLMCRLSSCISWAANSISNDVYFWLCRLTSAYGCQAPTPATVSHVCVLPAAQLSCLSSPVMGKLLEKWLLILKKSSYSTILDTQQQKKWHPSLQWCLQNLQKHLIFCIYYQQLAQRTTLQRSRLHMKPLGSHTLSTGQVSFIYITWHHKFASKGFTICTA